MALNAKYDHLLVEESRYQTWLEKGYFTAGDKSKDPFCIVIPPPNVTGKLHLGHAWDTTLQDMVARYKRMQGYDMLWLPGMDHAGIATQAKVDERLKKEGISRYDLGREKFLDRAWEWKEEYASFIRSQWAKMGLSLDYTRERFTLDEGLSAAVRRVFVNLYNEGLIYRGERIINWDVEAKTALSNIEVIHKEVEGAMYYFKYTVQETGETLVIATTRPETMFADQAIFVHPDDERYQHLIGKHAINPANGEALPIMADDYIDMSFGTAVMKCTPAHDPNDFMLAKKYNLDMPICMHPDGTMNAMAHKYEGMERFACRKALVADFEAAGVVDHIEKHMHQVGHSERLTCLVQNGETNFDTDLFLPLIEATEKYTNMPYSVRENKMSYRVIADHIRTVTFALADGALFSNEGRGYVLRRVLRRAVRFGKKLKIEGAFMYRLVPVVYEIMKDFYPYLGEKLDYIAKLVKAEEERFHATLADGEKLLMDVMEKCKDTKVIDGANCFKLYDTYGFPLELTLEIAEEQGYSVDKAGFDAEMNKQRERARNAREDAESMSSQSADLMAFTQESIFKGYDERTCEATVIGLFQNGVKVDEINDEGDMILDVTVCYGESGGQVGDSAAISGDASGRIENTIKAPHKQHLHHVKVSEGTLKVGSKLTVVVDEAKRDAITRNHSATHLLQSALKQVVGNHIQQAGSYVNDEYLRFDFTHFEKVNDAQLKEIETLINEYIAAHHEVSKVEMNIEDAKSSGATALFDEKYGDVVRVVTMGDVSKEFCGGCHVCNTQEIGVVKIVSEESIGSGIRRITAKTSFAAYAEFAALEATMGRIAETMKLKGLGQVEPKVEQMLNEIAMLKKQIASLQNEMFTLKANELSSNVKAGSKVNYLVQRFDGVDGKALKDIVSTLKGTCENIVVFLASADEDKITFVAGADKAAIANGFKCGDLVKEAALMTGGKGGGRPDLAQAGGKDLAKLSEALEFITNKLA